tara:strand:- start:93 stop:620 length:528 start_codon:yes stop_codon:yes gene_type:complete
MSNSSVRRGNIILNNLDNLEEINARIASRNIPSTNLPPCLSIRSTPTKYTKFLVNSDVKTCSMNTEPTNFTVSSVFLPGNRNGPFSGFSNNVNDESYLRNQYFSKQECPQSYWIPDSTSELFEYNVDYNIKPGPVLQEFPHLFKRENFGYFNPNPDNRIGFDLFNNSTRSQLKNI